MTSTEGTGVVLEKAAARSFPSPAASYLTGQTIVVEGGTIAW